MIVRPCALLAILASALPCLAQQSPLGLFPAKTSLVIRVAAPADLSQAAGAFLQNAAPQYAPLSTQLAAGLGSLIHNPTLQGVDPDRDWYLAVTFLDKKKPRLVFAIPSKDAKAMKSALGESFHSRSVDGWLFYSRQMGAIKSLGSQDAADFQSIQTVISEDARKIFGTGHYGMFVNLPALYEAYHEDVARFAENPFAKLPKEAKNENTKRTAKIFKELLKVVQDAWKDSSGYVESLTIGTKAVSGQAALLFKSGSETAKTIAGLEASTMPLLATLPSGWGVYFAAAGMREEIFATLTKAIYGAISAKGVSDEVVQALYAHDIQGLAGAYTIDGSGTGGAFRIMSLMNLGKPEGFLTDTKNLTQQIGSIKTAGMKQEYEWVEDAETIAGVSVDLVRANITIDSQADPTGAMKKMMTAMYGENGFVERIAMVGGTLVASVGGGKEQMKQAIQAAQGEEGPVTSDALTGLLDKLGKKGLFLIAIDVPRLGVSGMKLFTSIGGAPVPPAMKKALKTLKLEPSYAGLLVTGKKNAVHFDFRLPASQVSGIMKIGTAIQKAQRQRQKQPPLNLEE